MNKKKEHPGRGANVLKIWKNDNPADSKSLMINIDGEKFPLRICFQSFSLFLFAQNVSKIPTLELTKYFVSMASISSEELS